MRKIFKRASNGNEASTPYGPIHFRIYRWAEDDEFNVTVAVNEDWVQNPWGNRNEIFAISNVCHQYTDIGYAESIDAGISLAWQWLIDQRNEDYSYMLELAEELEVTNRWANIR